MRLALLACLAGAGAGRVFADPDYGRPILPGLDPLLKSTSEPRLLGPERLVLRERLLRQGVDPLREPGRRPDMSTLIRLKWRERAGVDLERRVSLREYNGPFGVVTEIAHPKFFNLLPSAEPLPGGFTWYPPRPLDDPVVEVFVDEIDSAMARRHAVGSVLARTDALDRTGGGKNAQETSLINLTIPVKLPRTLEKIIGKGEKTRIKITGREHIALSGESTVTKPFIASERVSSQSLFPTLDMEQQLQINLSGTIGEKIILEVDHNSEQLGPEATKIKLMYRGLEDEIIKTIETGDVGLTLPGSQLLGYSSNKTGLFGLKVTGQVGRADFTVVASKQKAESSSKSFNAKGGQVSDNIIKSSDYLNNRFFRLDLPEAESQGRRNGERIKYESVKIFQLLPPGQPQPDEITNVAAYVDQDGFRAWDTINFSVPVEYGPRWREITAFDPLTDASGTDVVAIDMRRRLDDADVLAVIYTVVDASGQVIRSVGDIPSPAGGSQVIDGGEGTYYRMKLLKAVSITSPQRVFDYVLRNIYSLGGTNIDAETFELRIERTDNVSPLDQNEIGLDYFRIFGLDRRGTQGGDRPDGIVDTTDELLFDLAKGLLKFPLDFPQPFNGTREQYEAYADTVNPANPDSSALQWPGSYLARNLAPELYSRDVLPEDYHNYARFNIIATHAAAASNFNLGASNIEEGSETVTLDGRTLTRDVDYEIDYTFGEIQLKGEAANLSADSKIAVDYQYAPFLGGGNSSLMGFSLGYDLGRDSKVATTWLYQSESIVGEKAKLGEEPSKNLVGNLNLQHTFKPSFLTTVANFLSRNDSERESTVQFSGELALSKPNPNTMGQVYLEDFEGVDASDMITLNRLGWSWSSAPKLGAAGLIEFPDARDFSPQNRVKTLRWFLPQVRTVRRHLNPDLVNQERDETQTTMDLYLRAEGLWQPETWGGIMRGISRTGLDLSKSQFIEIWVNDQMPNPLQRTGRLHIDFGYINEDGFWPDDGAGGLEVGTFQREDGITGTDPDGVWTYLEDIGLEGDESEPNLYKADYEYGGDAPFPRINKTARNNREDTEDLNANGRHDRVDGYFTVTIDLKETEALVDVLRDYTNVQDLIDAGIAWRKYRIPLAAVDSVSAGASASIKSITHARIWYENGGPTPPSTVHLQLSELRFLGSRWEREGVRRVDGEQLLSPGERLPDEEFFLGEVNNKENPDYSSPFAVRVENNIPDKEQSLVLNYQNLERGHLMRVSKQVSPRGDDYTNYRNMSWYWYNPSHATADLDLLFRVGADTLNYYEVAYRFSEGAVKTGWHRMSIGLAELSNAKNGELREDGALHAVVPDLETQEGYRVRVVGRPDLRRVRRYYMAVANNALTVPATGYLYINDVRLEGIKRESGMAQRAGVRVNMADVFKVDFDWKRNDDAFHGLDKRVGSGIDHEEWSLQSSLNIEDYVPLAGFRLPISGSRRQTIDQPKYVINSDIEIIDGDLLSAMTTLITREQVSARLNHTPAKAVLLRYLVDPWALQMNGSREVNEGPLLRSRNKSLQGSLTYDLRIPGSYTLAAYPLIGRVPIVKSLSLVPRKVALGASFGATENATTTISDTGVESLRPLDRKRNGKLTGALDYAPLPVMDMAFSVNSDRDLLRAQRRFGVNIGEENRRSYDLRITFSPPKNAKIPGGVWLTPARLFVKSLDKMNPSLQYSGGFGDVHDPALRQPGDPLDIRSISNSASWDLRFSVPIADAVKAVFPERKYSAGQRDQMVAAQRRLEDQNARRPQGGFPGRNPDGAAAGGEPEGTAPPPDTPPPTGEGTSPESTVPPAAEVTAPEEELLTPEERQRREEEQLLAQAEERLELEREQQRLAGTGEAAAPVVSAPGGGRGFGPHTLFNPFLSLLRNTQPMKVTLTTRDQSSYARLLDPASFWYQAGFTTDIDSDPSRYAASSFDHQESVSLATAMKVTRNLSLDFKYAKTESRREQVGSESRNRREDWPDVTMTLSGIEKWGLLGGGGKEGEGWFRSSNFNLGYKRGLTVNNYTATVFNPTISTTLQPRWSFTFPSGLSATMTANMKWDDARGNGVVTKTTQSRYGLQLRHQFKAERFLAKMGLYKPGASQNVNMDVDISYQSDRTDRINPGQSNTAPTGTKRISVEPRFTYQISRNLTGAMRFKFSRNSNIATDQTQTTLGLGVEATFVF